MFSDVVWNNPLTSFLLPKAETFEVAQDIVQVIDAQSSSTLYIPTMAWFSLFYPFLPLWMLNLLHWVSRGEPSPFLKERHLCLCTNLSHHFLSHQGYFRHHGF